MEYCCKYNNKYLEMRINLVNIRGKNGKIKVEIYEASLAIKEFKEIFYKKYYLFTPALIVMSCLCGKHWSVIRKEKHGKFDTQPKHS